ncbi:PAS domain-containing protein [Dechloromonas sp. XY25]|uniref:histidine kinase n=1 Tax=Dechloromonas hankyongensis TaxID=2908002 RepID=A0ABS9K4I7_9RHOO|nr:PAS domain-containing protein [Dechloromonas hankyongensis]MCG2578061.1 PAS domain-containing protein [Dechloromonas hankyongensis]
MTKQPAARYFAMACALTFATILRGLLLPSEDGLPFLTYYPTLIIVAIISGVGPSLVFIGLSAAAGNYFFLPPHEQLSFGSTESIACATYALFSGLIVWGISAYQQRIGRQAALLSQTTDTLTKAQQIAQLGSFECDAQSQTITWSEEEYRIYGLDSTSPAPSYRDMLARCIHRDDAAHLDQVFTQAIQTSSVYELEHRIVRPDGSIRWVYDRAHPYFDDRGQLLRYIGTTLDVTDRIKAEAALRDSEERFRALLTASTNVVYRMSPDWSEVHILSGQEFIPDTVKHSRNWLNKYIPPEDQPPVLMAINKAIEDRNIFELEHRVIRADGSLGWTSSRAIPILDDKGTITEWFGTATDITVRKRAEVAVIEAERQQRHHREFLECVIANAGSCISVVKGRELRYTMTNPQFLLTTNTENIVGRTYREVFQEAAGTGAEARLLQVLATGEPWHVESYPGPIPGKPDAIWQGRIVRLPEIEGEEPCLLAVTWEISAIKKVENALRDARNEAQSANLAKSRFLAAASHDLRQPLSALSIYASTLQHHVGPDGRAMLSNLGKCVESLSELLSDLLDLSKLEAKVVTVNVQDFALEEILKPLAAAHSQEANLKGLRLRCRATPCYVRSDPVLLRRIIANFLANAVRYTERGGVLVGCRRHAGKRWLEVWDTGIGIPPDKIPEAFVEFTQLDDQARTRGSGLGLAIVARMAKLLDLEVRVASRPGKGSLFAIELPAGQASAVPLVSEYHPINERSLCIALVEDNMDVREALVLGLQNLGHRVHAAASGPALLEKLDSDLPDIVISDYRLSHGETGFNVIERVRQLAGDELPALLITGDTDPALVSSMTARGIVVLHKPIDLETLMAYVEDATAPDMA